MATVNQLLGGAEIAYPSIREIFNVLSFSAGFNAAVVVFGATCLGIAAGIVGTFALLRKRALMGDALAHSTLPGLAGAFLFATYLGVDGKSLPILLLGATTTGILGVLSVLALVRFTRLSEDAAIGSVLSVFFGFGVVLLSVVQNGSSGGEGGLHHFIYGQTAAMQKADAIIVAGIALFSLAMAVLFLKEFRLVCFDQDFASVQGWPVTGIDLLMMSLIVIVTVVGLQTVGLILIIALLIVPACAARFWTERLSYMTFLSGGIGGLSAYIGSSISALAPRLPAGAIIVLTAGFFFAVSFLFAPARGVFASLFRQVSLRYSIARDHLLRSMYEAFEMIDSSEKESIDAWVFDAKELRVWNSWTVSERFVITSLLRFRGLIRSVSSGYNFTPTGLESAERVTRNHRLWEEYLLTYSGLTNSHVDYSADLAEHVLAEPLLSQLEDELRKQGRLPGRTTLPASVHPLDPLEQPKEEVTEHE